MKNAIDLVERGYVPDTITRIGIRRLLGVRLKQESHPTLELQEKALQNFVAGMNKAPIALATDEANDQHYEVPDDFFKIALGERLKYSSCYYPTGEETLEQAEEAMLALTCERAQLGQGQQILELGCGWGSLTLWMAEKYPESQITAVSNSATQKEYIDSQAKARGFNNVTVVTCDMNDYLAEANAYDRVISIEMFEHMRNYRMLLERISCWLKKDGQLFIHIFCHRDVAYTFETTADDDWMGKHFFTGGIMPAFHLPLYFQEHMRLDDHWAVDGTHYARTCEHWLENTDKNYEQAIAALATGRNPASPQIQLRRWRIFFMACAELFAYRGGREWFVGHYRFRNRG